MNVIFGAMYNEDMQDSCTVTVIATGLETTSAAPASPVASFMPPKQPRTPNPVVRPVNVVPTNQAVNGASKLNGLQRPPQELKSNVTERKLDIPNFLKK